MKIEKTAWTGPLVYHSVPQIDHAATGAKMRVLRTSHKISLREVARRLKLSAPFVSDLERGRRNWDTHRALAYMQAVTSAQIAQIQEAKKKSHTVNFHIGAIAP